MGRLTVIALGACGLALSGLAAAAQTDAGATVSVNEIWRALAPYNPNDPSNAADPNNPIDGNNPRGFRYHWVYSSTDSRTGLPTDLPDGDDRRREIDDDVGACVKTVKTMYESDGLPVRVPKSAFDNLEDQSAEMVLACVNHLHVTHLRWMHGVGVLMCEAHSGQCWGPSDVWTRKPAMIRR